MIMSIDRRNELIREASRLARETRIQAEWYDEQAISLGSEGERQHACDMAINLWDRYGRLCETIDNNRM